MIKSVALFTRRPGTTREAFRRHYETTHCRLGMKYYPFAKYLRNHVIESSRDIDFDCVSEFYFEEGRLTIDPMQTAAGELLRADERSFMDQSLIRPARATETILVGPPREPASPGTRRQILLIDHASGVGDEAFEAAIAAWAGVAGVLPGVLRISLDRTRSYAEDRLPFPCHALLSVWPERNAQPPELPQLPAAVLLQVLLLTDVCESSPAELAALHDPV